MAKPIKKTDKVGGAKFGQFISSLAKFDPQKVGETIGRLNPSTCTEGDLLLAYSELLLS